MKENLDLNQRLQQKLDRERMLVQELTQKSYGKLERELEAITSTAISTIKQDMQRQQLILTSIIGKFWLIPAGVGLSLCLGIFFGSWGVARYLSSRISQRQETLDYLEEKIDSQVAEIKQQQQTLESIQKQTAGITITQTDNGTFLTLPSYSTLTPGWQCQGKPCLKLE